MTDDQLKKIQSACKQFREAIERDTGNEKVFIGWVMILNEDVATGVNMSRKLRALEAANACFKINAMAYEEFDFTS